MRCTLIVPTEAQNYEEAIESAKEGMCRLGGGYTMYDCVGGWDSGNGELVEESVTVVEGYTSGDDYQFVSGWIEASADIIKEITGESAVMGTVNFEKIVVS